MGKIKDKIQQLKEDDLRKQVIIPLLKAFGCELVKDNHGPHENGKDIIYTTKHFLGIKIYGVVVLKAGDFTKKSTEIINSYSRQIKESKGQFLCPFSESPKKVQAHEILVITSKGITKDAEYLMYADASFRCILFIDGEKLERLIEGVIVENKRSKGKKYEFDPETFSNFLEAH
jgi:hypothetical protein